MLVAGNHDASLYGAHLDGHDGNVHYLCSSGVEIEGLKFWGVPMFMEDCISGKQEQLYAAITEDTDILVTHTPPYGMLDRDGSILYGSRELLERVRVIHPRLHLFGHIHKSHGTTSDGVTVFCNAAIMEEGYDNLNAPNLLSINVLMV